MQGVPPGGCVYVGWGWRGRCSTSLHFVEHSAHGSLLPGGTATDGYVVIWEARPLHIQSFVSLVEHKPASARPLMCRGGIPGILNVCDHDPQHIFCK